MRDILRDEAESHLRSALRLIDAIEEGLAGIHVQHALDLLRGEFPPAPHSDARPDPIAIVDSEHATPPPG